MVSAAHREDWKDALVLLTTTVVGAVTVGILYFGQALLIPVALAMFVTFVLSPIVNAIHRRGIPRAAAVIVVIAMVALGSSGLLWLVARQAALLTKELPKHTANVRAKIKSVKEMTSSVGGGEINEMLEDLRGELNGGAVEKKDSKDVRPEPAVPTRKNSERTQPPAPPESGIPNWISGMTAVAAPAVEILGNAALTFLLAAFMLIKREDMRNRVIRLIGPRKVAMTTKAINDAGKRISRYLLMQAIVNFSYGLTLAIGLWLLDVQFPFLWGALAGVLRYVPYVGPVIACIPPVLLSVAVAEGWTQPISVVILILAIELVSNNIMEPMLYGQSIGVSEAALILAAAFWAFLWGPVGLVLSGPLTVIMVVLGKHVPRLKAMAILLEDVPPLDPQVSFYQRLLARDQDEAATLARKYCATHDLASTFDELISPALRLAMEGAERDELDAADLHFIVEAAEEIVIDLGDDATSKEDPIDDNADRTPVKLLIWPARNQLDRVGAEMVRVLLPSHRWDVQVGSDASLKSEMLAAVAENKPPIVCITSFPPGGAAHTRALCKRLRARDPEVKLIVGRWGAHVDDEDRLEADGVHLDAVVQTFSEAVATLNGLHPVLMNSAATTVAV